MMTRQEFNVILRLAPEQLIEMDGAKFCRDNHESGRYCIRSKGHDGPHLVGDGFRWVDLNNHNGPIKQVRPFVAAYIWD